MHLAIAEPDEHVADLLTYVAGKRGHQAAAVSRPERLLERLPFEPAVAIIALDSIETEDLLTIQRLRQAYPDLVVFVTTEAPSKLAGVAALKAGVNDLIRKPFDPQELILRAEGWLAARGARPADSDGTCIADLDVDLGRYSATKNGVALNLTKLELRLLYCLMEHHPHVTPTERLLEFGWDDDEDPDISLIKTHISHIRAKLRAAGGVPFEIRSRQSIGYALQLIDIQ